MSNVLMIALRFFTVLATLFFLSLTVWSVITEQPVLLSVTGAMLIIGFGYFSYKDAKKVFGK